MQNAKINPPSNLINKHSGLTDMNILTNDQLSRICIAYEDIKRRHADNKLTQIPLENLDELPSIPGIYFAVTGAGTVIYIGMSKNLKGRCNLKSHHKLPRALGLDAKFLMIAKVDESIVEYVEKALISYFNPELNQAHARHEVREPEENRIRKRTLTSTTEVCDHAYPIMTAMRQRVLMTGVHVTRAIPQ
jgi:hypothetical protein